VNDAAALEPQVITALEPFWFLGTLVRPKLTGEQTGGRFALWEGVLPHGAAPPLHTHPQDETFYVLEGRVAVWLVEPEAAGDGRRTETHLSTCEPGAAVYAPAGTPHTFRVESDTARMLFLSMPAGIDEFVRALSEPARWTWLPPPADGPRVPGERLEAVEREHGVIRLGPPPTAAEPAVQNAHTRGHETGSLAPRRDSDARRRGSRRARVGQRASAPG
jgi:quercetin dioxygenase-like cupin family protein